MISDEKFRKIEHILKSKDFRQVYKKGNSAKIPGLVLCFLKNDLGYNRIGFSISSSSVKRANRRNRIRRLVREAYRRNKTGFKKSFDLIFIFKKDWPREASFSYAESMLAKIADKTGLKATS